jgi:hypothetical protein
MVFVKMSGDPTSSNVGLAFFNLLGEMVENSKEWNNGKKDNRLVLQEWAKKKYNYNIEYILNKKGKLTKIKIDTNDIFFVLKHG